MRVQIGCMNTWFHKSWRSTHSGHSKSSSKSLSQMLRYLCVFYKLAQNFCIHFLSCRTLFCCHRIPFCKLHGFPKRFHFFDPLALNFTPYFPAALSPSRYEMRVLEGPTWKRWILCGWVTQGLNMKAAKTDWIAQQCSSGHNILSLEKRQFRSCALLLIFRCFNFQHMKVTRYYIHVLKYIHNLM